MPHKHTHDPNAEMTERLLLAVTLFALAAILSSGGTMPGWEESLFNWIYGWPAFLNPFFITVTQLGSIFVLFALAALYLLRQKYHVTVKLLLSGTLAYLLSGVAKDLLGRPRPLELLSDISVRDFIVRGPGFPSGHAALATALAVTIWPYLPKRHRWIVPFTILGVGFSRVYLGVHAPLDVVGGIALGWACAELVRHVEVRSRQLRRRVRAKGLKSA